MIIKGKEYKSIVVADKDNKVIAIIDDESIVESSGYTVYLDDGKKEFKVRVV